MPCSPQELAAAAREAVAAGAGAAHFHVRAADERESLDADDVARAVSAVRAAIPGDAIWREHWIVDGAGCAGASREGGGVESVPGFASVNFNEEGGDCVGRKCCCRKAWASRQGWAACWRRRNFWRASWRRAADGFCWSRSSRRSNAALAVVAKIEALLRGAGIALPIILHGVGRTAWELIDVAARRGYDTRIGIEDVAYFAGRQSGREQRGTGRRSSSTLRVSYGQKLGY